MNFRARFLVTTALLGLMSGAHADDPAALLKLLQKAQRQELRGQVTSSVYFPPRANPDRSLKLLPHVRFVPWLLNKNFDVQLSDAQTVAGRNALRYVLTPKTGNAAHWTLWLDSATQLPLGFEERASDGTLVRRAQFTQVVGGARKRLAPLVNLPGDPSFKKAVLTALPGLSIPQGFQPLLYQNRVQGPEIVFSDGLNVLSLVISQRTVKSAPGLAARALPGGVLWLVGDLPQQELDATLAGVKAIRMDALGTFSPQDLSDQ